MHSFHYKQMVMFAALRGGLRRATIPQRITQMQQISQLAVLFYKTTPIGTIKGIINTITHNR